MNKRNLAIDIFRGLTMTLMVFVNEFWKVFNVPHWLEHYATLEDGTGHGTLRGAFHHHGNTGKRRAVLVCHLAAERPLGKGRDGQHKRRRHG